MKHSVFGHLVNRFASHPENLATEALFYILARSQVARAALTRFFASTGADIPDELFFRTQAAEADQAIPDLVGISNENKQVVICEIKFWAGLTDNQPVTYVQRSPQLLIFISPAKRMSTLWIELVSRCKSAGITLEDSSQTSEEMLTARINENQILAATSWRAILDTIHAALNSHGDLETASDVEQLRGLCDQMDTEAFLPVRSEELAPSIAIRNLQFNDVIDDVTEKLVAAGEVTTSGLRATPIREGYARYMKFGEFGCVLQVNSEYWSTIQETPFWFGIKEMPVESGSWFYSPKARRRLAPLEREFPTRLFRLADSLLVPLQVETGVERGVVIDLLLRQIRQVISLLRSVQP